MSGYSAEDTTNLGVKISLPSDEILIWSWIHSRDGKRTNENHTNQGPGVVFSLTSGENSVFQKEKLGIAYKLVTQNFSNTSFSNILFSLLLTKKTSHSQKNMISSREHRKSCDQNTYFNEGTLILKISTLSCLRQIYFQFFLQTFIQNQSQASR